MNNSLFNFSFIVLCGSFLLSHSTFAQNPAAYQIHGPTETSGIELDLHRIWAGLEYAIPPRQDLLESAVRTNMIPQTYIDEATRGMVSVLRKELLPPKIKDLDWRGLRNFRPNQNFLVTEYTTPTLETRFVIYAHPRQLNINVFSGSLFNGPPDKLTDEDILRALDKILAFPPESLASRTVEKTIAAAGGKPICYGKIRCCNYDEGTSPLKEQRWWNFLGFIFLEGQVCLFVSNHDYEHVGIPPNDLGLWEF